jgi:hypothetical protein
VNNILDTKVKIMKKKIIQGLTLLQTDGDTSIRKIMKFESHDLYHLITEYEDGRFEHEVMSGDEIMKKLNLDVEQLPNAFSKYHLSKEDIMSIPNDGDLGEFIRKKIYQK